MNRKYAYSSRCSVIAAAALLVSAAAAFAGGSGAAQPGINADAMRYYMRGSFMEVNNDLVHAYTYYSYADKNEPDNARIYLALARVTFEMGKLDETRRYAERLIEKKVYDSDARLILAEVEYEEKNTDKAVALLESIKEREDVPRFEVYRFLATIRLERNEIDAARESFEKARELDPGDLFVLYKLGLIYAESGEYELAAESMREAIEVNPGFASSYLALGSILLHSGDDAGAREAFEEVLELDPGNRTAVAELSRLYMDAGMVEEGVEILEPLDEQRQLGESGRMMLGRFYFGLGRHEDALRIFRGLVATFGEKPALLRIIAEIEADRGNLRTACGYLERLIEIEPDVFNNHVGLVLISNGLAGEPSGPEEDKRFSSVETRKYLEEAVDVMDASVYYDNFIVGTAYRKLGSGELAEKYLLTAEQLGPEERGVLLELASLYEDRGMFEDAIRRVRVIHRNEPDDPSINNFYGYLLAEKGDSLDFAEQMIKKALNSDPANGYFLDSLGWVSFRKGDFRSALEILLDAAKIVEDDPVIWEHIGDTYMELGQPAKALEFYIRSAEVDPDRPEIEGKLRVAREASSGAESRVE